MEIPEAHQVVYMMFSPRNITAWRRLRRLMKKERYDLVSCHTSLASFFTRMAMRGLKNRPKVACVAHGYLFGEESSAAKNLLFSTAERMAAPVTDLLMTTNSWDNGYAKDHKLGKQIVEVPGVGLDTHRLRPVHGEERMTLRAERVLFPGEVQMAPWYGAAALAVSASRSEGLPFNIMEAMYYGLPVVASQVKGYTDLLEETGGRAALSLWRLGSLRRLYSGPDPGPGVDGPDGGAGATGGGGLYPGPGTTYRYGPIWDVAPPGSARLCGTCVVEETSLT